MEASVVNVVVLSGSELKVRLPSTTKPSLGPVAPGDPSSPLGLVTFQLIATSDALHAAALSMTRTAPPGL